MPAATGMLSVLLGLVLPVRGFSATDLGVVLERDRGAALVLEQAALPSIVGEGNRTRMFAWYNIVQDLGHALGSLMAGMPYLMRTMGGVPVELSYQISLGACAALFGTGIIFQFAPFTAHRSAWRFRAAARFSQNPESPLSSVAI